MAGKERVAAVLGWPADRVLDQVRVHVLTAIVEERRRPWPPMGLRKPRNPDAILATEQIGHGHTEIGFARHAFGLSGEPSEEHVDRRARWILTGSLAAIRISTADGILDLVKRREVQQRLVDDERAFLGLDRDQLCSPKAFVQRVQAPDVTRMLARTGEGRIKAKISVSGALTLPSA